jgi:hypothetical protein
MNQVKEVAGTDPAAALSLKEGSRLADKLTEILNDMAGTSMQ